MVACFFFGFTGDDVTEAAPERQDLDAADAAARQRREQRRVGAAQVQPRLHAAPHRPVVGRVAPLHTNLRKKNTEDKSMKKKSNPSSIVFFDLWAPVMPIGLEVFRSIELDRFGIHLFGMGIRTFDQFRNHPNLRKERKWWKRCSIYMVANERSGAESKVLIGGKCRHYWFGANHSSRNGSLWLVSFQGNESTWIKVIWNMNLHLQIHEWYLCFAPSNWTVSAFTWFGMGFWSFVSWNSKQPFQCKTTWWSFRSSKQLSSSYFWNV